MHVLASFDACYHDMKPFYLNKIIIEVIFFLHIKSPL